MRIIGIGAGLAGIMMFCLQLMLIGTHIQSISAMAAVVMIMSVVMMAIGVMLAEEAENRAKK